MYELLKLFFAFMFICISIGATGRTRKRQTEERLARQAIKDRKKAAEDRKVALREALTADIVTITDYHDKGR